MKRRRFVTALAASPAVPALLAQQMGENPKTSVLNRWNQSHDVKNLFVVDGGRFTTGGTQNPTLTITALSMCASEHLADQMAKGNL